MFEFSFNSDDSSLNEEDQSKLEKKNSQFMGK